MNRVLNLPHLPKKFIVVSVLSLLASSAEAVIIGPNSTYYGTGALFSNNSGDFLTAIGSYALYSNSTGSNNAAVGSYPLYSNSSGSNNTAVGYKSLLFNTSGINNTAHGSQALYSNSLGGYNIALGYQAGYYLTGSYNINIGNAGVVNESNTIRIGNATQTSTYIAGIYGKVIGSNQPVCINANGQLGSGDCVGVVGATGAQGPIGLTGATGAKGDKGDPGINGTNGVNGKDGLPGKDGVNGLPGVKGDPGANGVNGLPGAKGDKGDPGANGLPGLNGKGVPAGGTLGQVLAKIDGTDFNSQWISLPIGSSAGNNTAYGINALHSNVTGLSNTAIGYRAGYKTTGSNNINIAHEGVAGESDTIRIGTTGQHKETYIAGIYSANFTKAVTRNVVVNANGKLGYSTAQETEIAALKAQVAAQATTITALQTQMAAQAADIAKLKAKVGL